MTKTTQLNVRLKEEIINKLKKKSEKLGFSTVNTYVASLAIIDSNK